MAKDRRGGEYVPPELNLAPIMNLVVILIPMLLLSVVFLEIGVINITAPKLSVGPPSETTEEPKEKLDLTVAVSAKGFRIAASNATLPEMPGCPVPGPTICLEDQNVDTSALFDSARTKLGQRNLAGGEADLRQAMSAYNWRELYNQLARIKGQFPDETIINVAADPDMPFAMIVRLMDTARYKLERDSYDAASEFYNAPYATTGERYDELFPDPVLSIAQ